MTTNKNRHKFRETCRERDNHQCIIPWCTNNPDDVHHILERRLWDDGGYIANNGVSICNKHHQYAEDNEIPPQAFWLWIALQNSNINPQQFEQWDNLEVNSPLPNSITTQDVNKWGDSFETPPWEEHRDNIKYQSTRHLLPLYWYDEETTAQERMEHDDTGLESVEDFVGIPLVITRKMDGGNCMMVNDVETPVRARNGSSPEDTMRPLYRDGGLYWQQQVNQKLPERFQVFGEWLWAKHSIHYGCDCEEPCDDVGSSLTELVDVDDERAYFQIFGVFDTELNMWLSWPMVEQVADYLGFPTTPVIYCEDDMDTATFKTKTEARNKLIEYARQVINEGGEGIVVRSKFPYHYDQFEQRVGKYVRENHVKDDEKHWSKRTVTQNKL